jgi:hypothetical protein
MLSVIILICSVSTQPQNCHSANALATLRGGQVASVMGCGRNAQTYLSQSALKPDPDREYAKVQCVQERP